MKFVQLMNGEYGLLLINLSKVTEVVYNDAGDTPELYIYTQLFSGDERWHFRGNEAEENFERIQGAVGVYATPKEEEVTENVH